MHVRGVVYWCLLSFYLCKCDQLDPVRVEDVGTAKKSDGASARGSPAGSNPHQQRSTSTSFAALSEAVSHAASHEISLLEACNEDMACLTMAAQDRAGLEAIQMLHRQLDDDANGNVDLSESDDFLREELQYDSGYERRQQAFHRNDDMHISVKELWEAWLRSEVHNWTVEQTTEWLAQNVELPQYIGTFLQHHVTGATLPRLAVNNMQYLSNILGIKDPIHKQKIALKAMDVVLFGPPKDSARWKDVLLLMLVVGAIGGGWAAVRASRASRRQLRRMLQDMEQLRRAEVALDDLQRELERARAEQENVNTEKQNLERRLREAGDAPHLSAVCSDLEVSQLKAEIEMLRSELRRAEGELEDRCWAPPVGLQQWLQLTHEVENRSYMRKKNAADLQLQQAREACEKLRKKRSSLVGAFVSTHGKSIDDVDRSIVEARTALNEVTQELQERVQRWKQIEMLCGFNIINNNGLQYLENALYRTPNGRPGRFRMSNSQDDLSLDDAASLYGGAAGGAGGATAQDGPFWREDSSGSEDHESPHYPLDLKLAEARAQLEERLAWEARSASIDDYNKRLRSDETRRYIDDMKRQLTDRSSMLDVRRNGVDEKRPMDDKRLPDDKRPSEDSRKQPAIKEPVQFTLGGDNVNWPNEEAPRSAQSQPQLRTAPPAPSNTTSSIPRSTSGPQQITALPSMPQPPPRRPHTAPNVGAMVRSRSTDVVLSSPEEPRVPPRATFTRQRTVAEEISQPGASSPSNSTLSMTSNPEDEGEATSTDSSLLDEDAKPRRRKILFPFVKSKSKVGHS